MTLSDVTFCWPFAGCLHNPDGKFGEEGKKLLYANKMHGTLKYGRHCNGQITSCKNRATLGKERGNHILVGKIQCLNLIACNHHLGESGPSAEF